MVFFTMASVGLPGLNGFVSEFLCILGAFQAGTFEGRNPGAFGAGLGPWYALAAGTGMIIAAMYLLYMVGNVVWGKLVEPHGHDHGHQEKDEAQEGGLPTDLCWREIGILIPLAVACLWLGLFPRPVLETLRHPALQVSGMISETRNKMKPAQPRPARQERPAPAEPKAEQPATGGGH